LSAGGESVELVLFCRNVGLYSMENFHIFRKIFLKLAHLPTLLLAVGYPVYWLELYIIKHGHGNTTWLATILFLAVGLVYFLKEKASGQGSLPDGEKVDSINKCIFSLGGILTLVLLACAFYASLLPPHTIQETDALNYHITLPRQHLILGSFQHIPWAADDFFLLPVDFALAPFWLATDFPNKFPQFLFFCGLVVVSINLGRRLGQGRFLTGVLIVFAIFGSHHVGIQMGSAMMDLVLCYLFLAALDSFLSGRMIFFVLEASFFIWSKAFIPFQTLAIIVFLFLFFRLLKLRGDQTVSWGFFDAIDQQLAGQYLSQLKKNILLFVILSSIIAGPFLVKSMVHTGTPFFPFAIGAWMINEDIDQESLNWKSTEASAHKFMTHVKDGYGYGRSPIEFIKHFWLVAVPDKGVNNKFDYPLGLIYLLILGPFAAMFFYSLKEHKFAIIPFFIIMYWCSWWFGSQQARFLYIPILLMIICVLSQIKSPTRVLMGAIVVALTLNTLSVVRANKRDWGKAPIEVLRAKDRGLLKINQQYIEQNQSGKIDLEFHDAAYAQFPVRVTKEKLPHTLAL